MNTNQQYPAHQRLIDLKDEKFLEFSSLVCNGGQVLISEFQQLLAQLQDYECALQYVSDSAIPADDVLIYISDTALNKVNDILKKYKLSSKEA